MTSSRTRQVSLKPERVGECLKLFRADFDGRPRTGAGLGGAPTLQDLKKAEANPLGGRGDHPYIPNEDLIKNLEAPKSRDELRARQEALNTPSGEGNAGEL